MITKNENMIEYTVENDYGRDYRFTGEILGSVHSSWNNAASDYSGQTGIAFDWFIYRAESGRYVCQRITKSQWQGAHTPEYHAIVCERVDDIVDFFGHGEWPSKLYKQTDLDFAVNV